MESRFALLAPAAEWRRQDFGWYRPLAGSCRPLWWSPLHEVVDPLVGDLAEAEALVEAEGGVEALDVDAERFAGGGGLGLEVAQDGGAGAGAPALGEEGDVDEVYGVGTVVEIEAPRGLAVEDATFAAA